MGRLLLSEAIVSTTRKISLYYDALLGLCDRISHSTLTNRNEANEGFPWIIRICFTNDARHLKDVHCMSAKSEIKYPTAV